MSTEQHISRHYTHGSLERAILDALKAAGKDTDRLGHADLAPADEFHIGGRQATIEFAAQLGLRPGMRVLDVGCGLGGASRFIAQEYGCHVSGIDLTEEFVRVAEALARRVGMAGQVSYRQASALSLPFADGSFDGAYMLHVGMNIADKRKLLDEIRRVLKPGGSFGIYDVMREAEGELTFPLPWATGPETSFVEPAARYKSLLEAAGFEILKERSRRAYAVEFFRQMRERAAQGGASPVGSHIVMGHAAPQKIANLIGLLERGLIAPVEIIARAA